MAIIQLSPNFSLDEMIISQTASRLKISNVPSQVIVTRLKYTASQMELVRQLLGNVPIIISSGYRSQKLNKAVGGVTTSQHCKGDAVDFIAPDFGSPKDIVKLIAKSNIPFDQLIHEFHAWVHISFSDKPRRQVLTIDKKGSRPFLL